jgi:hypothetical protein
MDCLNSNLETQHTNYITSAAARNRASRTTKGKKKAEKPGLIKLLANVLLFEFDFIFVNVRSYV